MSVVSIDSNAAKLFEGVEVGLGDAEVGACVVEDEEGGSTAAVKRGVEGKGDDGCCLSSGILIDTCGGSIGEDGDTDG